MYAHPKFAKARSLDLPGIGPAGGLGSGAILHGPECGTVGGAGLVGGGDVGARGVDFGGGTVDLGSRGVDFGGRGVDLGSYIGGRFTDVAKII